jgi:hypothetical protein
MLASLTRLHHWNQSFVDEKAMVRRQMEIAARCMIIDRKARHADRHYGILLSPAFFFCEFVIANPLNGFRTGKRLNFVPDLPSCTRRSPAGVEIVVPLIGILCLGEFVEVQYFVQMQTFWLTQAREYLRQLQPLS